MRFMRSAFCLAFLLSFGGAAISLRLDDSQTAPSLGSGPDARAPSHKIDSAGTQRVATGDWADNLRSEEYWRQMRSPQSRPDTGLRRTASPPRAAPKTSPIGKWDGGRSRTRSAKLKESGPYRTVCVRLCDGYFWPVSFATTRSSLEHDRHTCERSCESPTRLYLARDVETALEDMKDETGKYYNNLKTAFVYRSSYLADCKCRAHPWEAEAQARHAGYAQAAKPAVRRR